MPIAAPSAAINLKRSRTSPPSRRRNAPNAMACLSARSPRPGCTSKAPAGISTTTPPREASRLPIPVPKQSRPMPRLRQPRLTGLRQRPHPHLRPPPLRIHPGPAHRGPARLGPVRQGPARPGPARLRPLQLPESPYAIPSCFSFAAITSVYLFPEPVLNRTTRSSACRNPVASRRS